MIATLAEIKAILGYDSSHDTLLTVLMPLVQDDILSYLKNYFMDSDYYITVNTLGFSASSITDSGSGFVTAGLVTGSVVVEGSKYNDGFYTVTNVAAGTLTISETLITEVADTTRYVNITRVVFPKGLKAIFADLLRFRIENNSLTYGMKKETLPDGYSIEYDTTMTGYPKNIVSGLDKWKKVSLR